MGLGILDKLYDKWVKLLMRDRITREFPLSDFDRILYEIRPCDVLLIEGRARVSEIIRQVTSSPWTHAVLYIGKLHDVDDPQLREVIAEHYDGDPNEQLIIQSILGKGTIISPLSMYRNEHIRICRPKGISRRDAQQVVAYAISRLGADYNVRHIVDLMRLLIPWKIMPRRWRSSLFTDSPSQAARVICSTLIAEAFKFVQFPILPVLTKHKERGYELIPRSPRLYTPGDFDYSPYFEIIKYPFLEVSEHAAYRKLPWTQDEVMSDDEGMLYKHAPTTATYDVGPDTNGKDDKSGGSDTENPDPSVTDEQDPASPDAKNSKNKTGKAGDKEKH